MGNCVIKGGLQGRDALCEPVARWEVKALMAAVELQRHADGTEYVTLRSSDEEKRFKDIVISSQPPED